VSHGVAGDPNLMPLTPSHAKPPRPAHDAVDFRKRVLHVASHPTEPTFLVAGLDRAYLFHLHQGPGSSAASDDTAGNA
jgi:hypothetical protein